jgi:hypothetical protein
MKLQDQRYRDVTSRLLRTPDQLQAQNFVVPLVADQFLASIRLHISVEQRARQKEDKLVRKWRLAEADTDTVKDTVNMDTALSQEQTAEQDRTLMEAEEMIDSGEFDSQAIGWY